MRTRDGKKESSNRGATEGRTNGIYTLDGTSSSVSRNKSKTGESSNSIGSTIGANENGINEAAWFDPIDETSPKMRMAGPEESKNEREVSDCPDGVCPVPWATKEEPLLPLHEKAIENSDSPLTEALKTHIFKAFDEVNKPAHYASGSIECIDAIEAQLNQQEFRGYLKGNIAKYLWREHKKGGVQSLKKARWYLDKLISLGG